MTQEEKIKDLEERIALMDADHSSLATDLVHWKKVAAGLKGRNKQLTEQVKHYKAIDKEGDELNETRIAEIGKLKALIVEKDKTICGLQSQANKLVAQNKELEKEIKAERDLIDEYELAIHELQTPWWKKIF